jgi:ferredoxin
VREEARKYGSTRDITRKGAESFLPLYDWIKRISSYPIIKWLLNPWWSPRRWQLTVIPINVEITSPGTVSVPRNIMERLIDEMDDIFVMNTCYCRDVFRNKQEYMDIGCMAFGPSTRKIHPTHGRFVNKQEAKDHVRKAAQAGLVANVNNVWIDPVTWGSTPLNEQIFVCFCDDKCFYRGGMKKRGPNLNETHMKLPGSYVVVDSAKCDGCAACVESCFVAEMRLNEGIATPGKDCKVCGRCVEVCPRAAVEVCFDDEEIIYSNVMDRLRAKAVFLDKD